MDAELKDFYIVDPGFAQFAERHGIVTGTPEFRKAYRRWEYEQVLEAHAEWRKAKKHETELAEREALGRAEGERKGRAEGELKGRVEGEQKGRTEAQMDIALRLLKLKGHIGHQATLDDELRALGIPDSILEKARAICTTTKEADGEETNADNR
jgi:flagellar biosynthesis/type III secretory pathway protein FliH